MTRHNEIIKLNEMLDDDEAVEGIGSELLKKAIRAQTEENLDLPPGDEQTVRRVIERGDEVPFDLANEVSVTPAGRAADGWEKTWLNLGLWDRNWSQNENETIKRQNLSDLNVRNVTPLEHFRMESILTDDEIQILEDLDMLEDFS